MCEKEFEGWPHNTNKFCSYKCYWESKRYKIKLQCEYCKQEFETIKSAKWNYMGNKPTRKHFCSKDCQNKHMEKHHSIITKCKYCGKLVKRGKASIHPSGNIYCSRKCSTNAIKKPGRKETPMFKLNQNISRAIRNTLNGNKKGGYHWEDLVGYTLKDLMKHLEKQFKEGMTWENHGKIKKESQTWNIDHIVPISAFNFSDYNQIDFKRCWALKNLRPMWAKQNIIKQNKLENDFQPALAI